MDFCYNDTDEHKKIDKFSYVDRSILCVKHIDTH